MNLEQAFCQPSLIHIFGCDAMGVDLLERITLGVLRSLGIALLVVTVKYLAAIALASLLSQTKGMARAMGERCLEILLSFPGVLLALLLASVMPGSTTSVVIALILTGWAAPTKFLTSLMDEVLKQPHVESARAAGATQLRILRKAVLPCISGQIAIQMTLSLSGVILAEAALSFLGLGGRFESKSLGVLISEGRSYLVEYPRLSVLPGLALFFTVASFQILAEKQRGRFSR